MDEENKFLSVYIDYEDIKSWGDNEITTTPKETGLGCADYVYKIDRKSKTITSTRRTLTNTSDCEGTQKEPIVMTLDDGYKRLNK